MILKIDRNCTLQKLLNEVESSKLMMTMIDVPIDIAATSSIQEPLNLKHWTKVSIILPFHVTLSFPSQGRQSLAALCKIENWLSPSLGFTKLEDEWSEPKFGGPYIGINAKHRARACPGQAIW